MAAEAASVEQGAGEAAEPRLTIERLTKHFGGFTAVDGVSLEIRRGEIFCLLGGSGSGKTTLLRLLAGLESPDAGRVLIDGEDMSGIPPYRRPLNMMFQSYALFPHMTVERNVAFGLEQERLPRREIASRTGEMLEMVQMASYARRKPHQLSGGQRQRVALARALAKRPKLLLLDEPLAALDRKLREHTQFELLALQKRLGVTFIVVTHDQQEAMTLASRMGIMDRGRIVQVGAPAEIYETPATRFVADFIGAANLFEGRVIRAGPGTRGSADEFDVECPELGTEIHVVRSVAGGNGNAGAVRAVGPGANVWIAIRPERIRLFPGGTRPPASAPAIAYAAGALATATLEGLVEGVVEEVAYRGEACTYLVRLPRGSVVRATGAGTLEGESRRIARGDAVRLGWHPSSPILLTE